MDVIKGILGFLLGAGKGWLGTVIRTLVAGAAGWLASKGIIEPDATAAITDHILAVVLAILAGVGSALNNEIQLNKEPPK